MNRPDAPDLTAWSIHGRHACHVPQARCIIHLHPPYATALASLANPEILPIDQNTARFYNRVAFDMDYGGMANTDAEGDRLGRLLGNKQIMMMGNHGVLVCASTVAEAFDLTYYLERACRNLCWPIQTGQKLNVMSPAVAEKTAQEWEADRDQFQSHFAEMKAHPRQPGPLLRRLTAAVLSAPAKAARKRPSPASWRGGRAVDCGGLENR